MRNFKILTMSIMLWLQQGESAVEAALPDTTKTNGLVRTDCGTCK